MAMANQHPAHIYFSGRNLSRAQELISDIHKTIPTASLTFIELDLSSLLSIKTAIQQFSHKRLDILMCNAGIMAKPPQLSKDGYEIQFATNHLGHALLIKHLLPIMLGTVEKPGADVRIVLLTSTGWRGHPKGGINFAGLKTTQDFGAFGPWIRYGQSKLANIVYAAELARRYPSIISISVHPGSSYLLTKLLFSCIGAPEAGAVSRPPKWITLVYLSVSALTTAPSSRVLTK